jgi:hypothetical protein
LKQDNLALNSRNRLDTILPLLGERAGVRAEFSHESNFSDWLQIAENPVTSTGDTEYLKKSAFFE